MAAEAGDLAKTIGINVLSAPVADATPIAKGDIISFDANGNIVKATASVGDQAAGFGVAMDTKTANDGQLNLKYASRGTYVYVRSGGVIQPGKLVTVDASSDAIVHAEPADAALSAIFSDTEAEAEIDLVRDYYGRTVGQYLGHEGEEETQTAAADTDVIIVRLY